MIASLFAVPRLPVRNLSPSASWAVLSSADVLPRTFLVPLSPAPEQQLIPASTAQECFGLCRNRTNCGMAIYNPASNTCFPALLVGMNSSALRALTPQQALTRQGCTDATGCVITMRTPGSCGLVASSGIVASGMQWATWALGKMQHVCMQNGTERHTAHILLLICMIGLPSCMLCCCASPCRLCQRLVGQCK